MVDPGSTRRSPARGADDPDAAVVVQPVFVLSRSFPARPSSIPEIHDFIRQHLEGAPLSDARSQQVRQAALTALLEAASADGGAIHVSFRFLPDSVEVDLLHAPAATAELPVPAHAGPDASASFAAWLAAMLKREGLSQEAAARQLGVSVKTVSRWVGGETEPRLRDLRRIHQVFGEAPIA